MSYVYSTIQQSNGNSATRKSAYCSPPTSNKRAIAQM